MTVSTVPAYLQNASHSAALFRQALSGAYATGGILGVGEMAVAQQGTPNMSVILGAGRVMIPGTSVSPQSGFTWTTQGMYYALNDAPLTLTVATSNPTNPRIDAVYVQVQDSYYSGASNTGVAGISQGTAAPSPVAPSIPTNAILIAYIAVAANATSIINANITAQQTSAKLSQNGMGLVPVIPATVVNGTVGPNGSVTVSTASGVSLNGVFSAKFSNYLVICSLTSSVNGAGVQMRLRSSGTDNAVNYVYSGFSNTAGGGVAAWTSTSATYWDIGRMSSFTPNGNSTLTVMGPFASTTTDCLWTSGGDNGSGFTFVQAGGFHNVTASFDGFTLYTSSGTFSGTIQVYGYNNN